MTTPISNRTEFDAAQKRQAELQRSAGNDPERQRELRELTEKVEAYRRANPTEAGRASTAGERSGRTADDANTAPDLSGQNVYDPHNQNNVGTGINDPNRSQVSPSDPNRNDPGRTDRASTLPAGGTPGTPGPLGTPGTPGSSTSSTGNR
jgi:hypothetical protein